SLCFLIRLRFLCILISIRSLRFQGLSVCNVNLILTQGAILFIYIKKRVLLTISLAANKIFLHLLLYGTNKPEAGQDMTGSYSDIIVVSVVILSSS
ncbi:MAG TPA: hypothetical protein PK489_00965, partial [Prolixibacteraceae bacterium]|nr:hypothetical protein [Prolixibacteraceae bacterium]